MTLDTPQDVRCPRCNAAPGQRCWSDFDGIWEYGYHHARERRLSAIEAKAARDGVPLGGTVRVPARWVR
jgi:hypothetical protein